MGVQRGSRFFLLLAFVVLILSLVRVDAQESSSTLETTAESSTVAATTDPITSTTDPATSTTDPATSTTDPATSTTDPATTTVEPTTTPEVSSSSAIEAVASSSSTIEAVISSSSTIEAVISSSSAIEAVASSSSTIEAVISSSSAIEATTTTFAITTVDPTSTSTAVASSSTTDAGSIAAATSTDHSSTASSISAAVITTAATSTDHSSTSSASAAAEATSSSSAAAASTDHSSSTASAAAASTSSVSAASISTDHSSATSSAAAASTSSVSAASVSTDHSSATSSAAAASMVASTSSAAAASTSSVSAASVSTDHSSATSSAAAASTSTVSAIVASTSSASAASTPSVSAAATSTDHSSATSSAAAASTSSVSAMVASTSSASAASTPSVSAAATSTDHSSATSSAASASMSSAASASTLAVSAASTSSVSGAPTSSASAAAASTSSTSAASTTPAIAGSTSSMSTTHASAASTSTVASTTSATTTTTTSSTASSTPTINPGTGSGSGFPFTFGLPVSSSQGIPPNYQMCQFKNMSMSCLTHWSTGAFAPPMAGWTCRIDVASLNANVMTFFCGPPSDWISGGSTNWTQGPPMDLTNGLPLLWVNCTQSGTAMKCTAADGHTFTPYTGWECRQDTSVANVRTNFFCSDQYVPRPENWPSEAAGYQQNGYMQCSRNATTSQVTCGPDANGRYFEATSGGGFECRTDDRNALYCRYSQMDPNACMTNGTSNCSLDGYYKCMENKNIFQNASLITNRNLSLVVCNTNDTNLPFILPQDWACASAQSLGPVAATNFTGMYCRKSTASFPAGYEPGKLIVCNPNINNTTPPRSMGGPMPSPTMSSGPMAPPAMSSGVMPPPTMSSGAMPPPTTSAAPMPSASSAPMNNTGNMSGAMLRRSWAKSLLRRNAKRFGAPKRSVPVPVKDLSGPAIQLSRRSMPVDFSPISHHLSRRDNIADYYQYDNMGNITCAPGNNATYAKCYDRFGSPPLEVMRTMCKTVAVAWQNTTGATNATKTGPYYANSVLCSKSSPCAANTFPYPVTPSFSVESAGTLFKIAYVPIYLSPINTTSPSVYDASLYPVWSNATSNGPWYPFPYPLPTAVNCPSGNQGAIACVKYAWVYPQIKLPGVDCPVSTGCSNSTLLQYQPSGNATVEPTWYSNLASYPRNMFGPSVASLPAWYQGPVAYDKSWFDSTQVITSLNNLYAPFFSSEGRTLWATAITAGPMWPDLAGVSKRVMAIEKVNGAVWPTFPFAPFPSDSTSAPRAFEFFPLASIAAEKPYFTPGVADLMTMMNVTAAPPPVVVPPPVANATNPCPAPPTSGTILFIGSALEDGSTSSLRKTGSAQAVFSLDSYSCRIGVPSLYWNLDMANSTTIIATNSTSYPLSIAALTFGSHSLSVRAVIPDVTNASITYTVNVASSFVMKRPANYAILTTGNLNSSTSFPLSLDASDSIDGQDPCYFTQFKSAAALNRCKLNNVGFPRAVKPLVRFKCQTKAGNACAFPLTSTATFANLQSNTTRTTGGNVAFFASTDGSFQTITTDMPYFSLPVSSLVAGDYLFTVELVFSDETTSSPSASSPSSITLAATPTYLISALSALSPTNVFAGSAITFNSSVTTNSPIGELTFTWRIYTATQDFAIATFGRAFGRSGLRVDTTNLPESNFMISVTVRDATNVATN
ncbi:hypothetical protein DFS34DRAFT_511588 [Phlyctochytrium arcticum]|nr:hypothetical protein DFS34DRAFT_511588 [Phlyctochytrium arcticum]